MNQPKEMSSEQGLIESILADAETQAGALLADAEATARGSIEQSEKEAAAIGEKILAKAKLDAEAQTIRTCAKARVEARRILLQAREKAIDGIFERIEKTLQEIRGDALRYRTSLVCLLTEAILGIGEEHVVIVVGAADKTVLDDILMEDIKKQVCERSGRTVTVELQFKDSDLGGGGIVLEPGGRVRLDNTFPRRLKETKQKLKTLIVAEIEKNCG
ncbi:MAG TPA: V-type ATP synthase subunit E family protein [Candidatus Hydrogenedentes bacterium]|nr:V-type ATP synthase subunit E family protein [Candidatus Hydrogenedentota bacterium]